MKISSAISLLQNILEERGDLDLQIDHPNFITTLDIEDISVGDSYINPHKYYAYVYPLDDDASHLISECVDRGYEEAKKKL